MRRDFQRPERRRQIGRKVVIACEGTKSERGYFNAIRATHKLSTVLVVIARPEGSDPLSVVSAAIRKRGEQRAEPGGWRKGDSAWAVFDGDEHIANSRENWNQALSLAQRERVELAISNPCFELWYLLHFQDQFARLSRNQAEALLRRYLGRYQKSQILYPDPLSGLTGSAIERAGALAARALENQLPPHENPCAGACRLVELLLSLTNQ